MNDAGCGFDANESDGPHKALTLRPRHLPRASLERGHQALGMLGPHTPHLAARARPGGRHIASTVRAALVIVALSMSLSGCNSPFTPISPNGSVAFRDSSPGREGVINAVSITAANLPSPAEGKRYICWLVDRERAAAIRLGQLVPGDASQGSMWKLQFQISETGPNLLFSGEKRQLEVLVTQEPQDSLATIPSGPIALRGQVPDIPFFHVQHLLVGHPLDNPPGHLVRLLRQAQILTEEPMAELLLAMDGVYPQWEVACAAQSIIDMIQGSDGADYGQLPHRCTDAHFPITQVGDGHGILQHVQDTLAHVVAAERATGFTSQMKQGADELRDDAANVLAWYTTASQYAVEIVHGNNIHARDLRALCEEALRGDPDTGKRGIFQAYAAAQRMATLQLTPP